MSIVETQQQKVRKDKNQKKLTHRIHQKRVQEVRMSSQLDDLDTDREDERNFYDIKTEKSAQQNVTKLNYHCYMNKQIRSKWSKSDTDLFYQLLLDKTCHQARQKFKTEERKNPTLVHDAITHRSGDNLYFKKVIKQLNIEDVLSEINSTHKKEAASNGGPFNEDTLEDFINEEEENGSNCQNNLDEIRTRTSDLSDYGSAMSESVLVGLPSVQVTVALWKTQVLLADGTGVHGFVDAIVYFSEEGLHDGHVWARRKTIC
ncbi:hypothetical protein ACP4OV_012795 [Aristida adscensionis]